MNFHDETGPSSTRAARLTLTFCCVIVFLGSVGIMVLELTASRLIARAVGQSLYTWTSVIGVVLAGLSAGNILGGRIVERPYAGRWLSAMFVAAGILCLAAEPIMGMFVAVGRPSWFNWPAWVVVTVSSVLLAPSVALGTISPIAASIALLRARRIGMTMGNIYAWGALGSILGTFATGYFLVNVMGTR